MTPFNHEGIEFILSGICSKWTEKLIREGTPYFTIYKASPREWAEQLICEGTLYFTTLKSFQLDEHPERGDSLEGTATVIRQGQKCTTSSLNPIFVCCFTMEAGQKCILNTWKDSNPVRDTVVQICDTLTFVKRIHGYVKTNGMLLKVQVGDVAYDKDEGSDREPFRGESTFQKNLRFSGQKEFRFALEGWTNKREEYILVDGKHLVLKLGDCSDILRIV